MEAMCSSKHRFELELHGKKSQKASRILNGFKVSVQICYILIYVLHLTGILLSRPQCLVFVTLFV
jgi:hypothetical protein